ncbi:MAG: hypothetical protein ACETWK_10360 [Candidatus Aminicenantaceae bacterium]
MIDVQEHFYEDDPLRGHPDVRTKLKDVSYFFLGNGHIQAALQVAPSNEGTAIGLLIMDPEHLRKKRESLTMDYEYGLKNTMIRIHNGKAEETIKSESLKAEWTDECKIPVVQIQWCTASFQVSEYFYCPNRILPVLIRRVRIKNIAGRSFKMQLQTGILKKNIYKELNFSLEEEKDVYLSYRLDSSGKQVILEFAQEGAANGKAVEYWGKIASVYFGYSLIDHYFRASLFQLPAVISRTGKVDGSIWQYNREWIRDQAMMAVGLTVSGHHEIARRMLDRLLEKFVSSEGDTVDSSEKRDFDDVELDQNGVLLFAIKNYVLWTGDLEVITRNWDKISATAEFPLKDVFRHPPSGLVANRREYWERHQAHGIQTGMELANQMFVAVGLSSAAMLARLVSRESEALRWEKESHRIKQAMLDVNPYSMLDSRGFIKRRSIDGSVQEKINTLPDARLPEGVPLVSKGDHFLEPDASAALPIAMEFISSDSLISSKTLDQLEKLWNQAWEGGGYGRYHVSSEPDSPGPWPIPSLFIARAYTETGNFDKVWRVLRWLNTLPGAMAGSWFEFYGPRFAPPFPQVGIPPWTWAEMLILLIRHFLGIQPDVNFIRIRPKLLPGLERIQASLPLRDERLELEIKRNTKNREYKFRTNGIIVKSLEKEANVSYSKGKLWIEASVP